MENRETCEEIHGLPQLGVGDTEIVILLKTKEAISILRLHKPRGAQP